MRQGAMVDFELDDVAQICGPQGLAWKLDLALRAVFGSDVIVAASRPLDEGITQAPGIYFLIWDDLICYAGQALSIFERIVCHENEGRPFQRVATICGVPKWAQTEIEYAYSTGWHLPWNSEATRCGQLYSMPELREAIGKADQSRVMPTFCPAVTREQAFWPNWEQQVLGRFQSKGKQ